MSYSIASRSSVVMVDPKFHHPYEPYDIQLQLMRHIYDTIDNGHKIGLFESPTGTGKTLSLICSTMSWLRHYKNTHSAVAEASDDSDDEPEWVTQQYRSSILSASKQKYKDYERHLDEAAEEYESKRHKIHKLEQKRKKVETEDDLLPQDYTSDSEVTDKNELLKDEISRLLQKIEGNRPVAEDLENCTKIFFSSRTHSQLNQFTHQLSLATFESSLDDVPERTKYIPLGSRKQLCINPTVSRLANNDSINDACRDKNKSEAKCEYFQALANDQLQAQFNDYSLTKIHDIEELANLGKQLKICPYYSVRNDLKLTEVVSLPYQMLLDQTTRETLNINLKDSIIIIDEAHNLFDAITSLNSVTISFSDVQKIISSLKGYLAKFSKRLNSGNRIYLLKLMKTCNILSKFISSSIKNSSIRSGAEINMAELFVGTTGDLFNIHKLDNYMSKSRIAYKIENYMEKSLQEKGSTSNPLLFRLSKFLKAMSNPSAEGKFFWDVTDAQAPSINYMLLDPSSLFKPIVDECKCLILCGGTMEPISDYTDYLFPYLSGTSIQTFSCNHIIPDSNLKVFPVPKYNDQPFEFLYKNRNNSALASGLGECLYKLLEKIPYGVVCFFPSYKLLDFVLDQWKTSGIYQKLLKLKANIFVEPKSTSDVDKVLSSYAQSVSEEKGGLLLSVVGGKLSEGINFSDNLARAVIMVGLPYPNLMSGEIIARKNYIEKSVLSRGQPLAAAQAASKQYVENICMRAVNQSIGRSIRHINDYSVIYLVDSRYTSSNIQSKLSGWIRKRIQKNLSFAEVLDHTEEFFVSKSVATLT